MNVMHTPGPDLENKSYRWFNLVTALFVTTLIVSNIIAVKVVQIFGLIVPAAVILFPVAYIFGDILTEVYGYAKARQVIWTGFFCNLLAVVAFWIGGLLPSAAFWTDQSAYQSILGNTPRILLASFIAYLVGEFLNSFVLAKLKVQTSGRFLWLRTISSTLVGQGADSAVFLTVAGLFPVALLGQAILTQWLFKVTFEVVAIPLTYVVVGWLKRAEGVDYYDRETNFTPIQF
jgi:uncharacterized integral membrane protein (TIGR00697 family)